MSKSVLGVRFFGSAFAVAASMLLATACGGGGAASSSGETVTPDGEKATGASGKKAAEVSASYVGGDGPKTLADAKGKVVIVDFWATYCGPCKASFPKYQEMLDQFGGDLAVIAVSVDEPDDASEEKLKEFAKNAGVKFTILWDKEKKTAQSYSPPKMPTSFVIDKEGNIAHVHAGYESGEELKIAEEVKALIGK